MRVYIRITYLGEQCGMLTPLVHHAGGRSLTLGERKNNMNKPVELVIQWSAQKFHTDVQKNVEKTIRDIYRNERLEPLEPLKGKVIKTLIYGVRSSRNQPHK